MRGGASDEYGNGEISNGMGNRTEDDDENQHEVPKQLETAEKNKDLKPVPARASSSKLERAHAPFDHRHEHPKRAWKDRESSPASCP